MNHLEEHKRTVMCSSSFKGQNFKCKTRMSRKTVHQIFSKASNSNWGTCLFCCIQTFATSILLNIFPPTCFSVFHVAPSTRTDVTSMWTFKKPVRQSWCGQRFYHLYLLLNWQNGWNSLWLRIWICHSQPWRMNLSRMFMQFLTIHKILKPHLSLLAVLAPHPSFWTSVDYKRMYLSFLNNSFTVSAFLHLTPPLLCCLNIHRLQSITKLMLWLFHFSKPIRQ